MKHEKLLDAIGRVDGDLVQEAEDVKTLAVPRTSNHWRRWAALAAVAVLAVGLFWARAWMGSVTGSDTAADAAAEDAATGETAEEAEAADEGGSSGQASVLWPPLLSVQGSDGQPVTVAGEAVETEAEDALTGAEGESGTDAASAESAEEESGMDAEDYRTEDAEGLPTVTYDPAQRTLTLTLEEDDSASVTAVCTNEDSGGEAVLIVTDGVLTLLEGGDGWLVEVTVQWADGETCVYVFWAEPDGGA